MCAMHVTAQEFASLLGLFRIARVSIQTRDNVLIVIKNKRIRPPKRKTQFENVYLCDLCDSGHV